MTLVLKCILLGESGTGKTSFFNQLVHGVFSDAVDPTIGVDFGSRDFGQDHPLLGTAPSLRRIRLQVWDTAGQEQFRAITSAYFRDVDIAFIVYDVGCRRSFCATERWIRDVRAMSPSVHCTLVGNKSDTRPCAVPTCEGVAMAKRLCTSFATLTCKHSGEVNCIVTSAVRSFLQLVSHVDLEKAGRNGHGAVHMRDIRANAHAGDAGLACDSCISPTPRRRCCA